MKRDTFLIRGLAIVLCILTQDAHAWGLGTHMYFAEALTALPLAVPVFLAAMRRFPGWVLAGACLPDLALFGEICGTKAFIHNHQWGTAHRLLHSARSDEEKAAAVGYCSHLFVDVVAHNHFVPSHEQRWINVPHLTHAAAEWAMDAYLRDHIKMWPAEALCAEQHQLAQYIADNFSCPSTAVKKTLRTLMRADALLRSTRLPQTCYYLARALDHGLAERFDQYIATTAKALPQIGGVLAGVEPRWHPEGVELPILPLQDFAMLASK